MRPTEIKGLRQAILKSAQHQGISLKQLALTFGLSPSQMMALIRDQRNIIKPKHISLFERNMGISIESFIEDEVEPALLRQRISSASPTPPDRYLSYRYSHIRTTANIIEYLQFLKGWGFVRRLLGELNVKADLFEQQDETINFLFFSDLFKSLENCQIGISELKSMAQHSALKNMDTPFGVPFKNARTDAQVYLLLKQKISNFDSNFDYRIIVEPTRATLITNYRQQVQDELQLSQMGSRNACLYKQHVFGAMPLYANRPALKPIEKSCLYLGDACCEYFVEFPTPQPMLVQL